MTSKDLHDLAKYLMDLHFVQANSLVAAKLQNNKDAIKYMKRIAELREIVKLEVGIKVEQAPFSVWIDLTKEESFEICSQYKDHPFSLLVAVQNKLREKNDCRTNQT